MFKDLRSRLSVKDEWKQYYTLRFIFTALIYNLIRPLFVKGWDFNEDYNCGHCGKPVLTRVLYCSDSCYNLYLEENTKQAHGELDEDSSKI